MPCSFILLEDAPFTHQYDFMPIFYLLFMASSRRRKRGKKFNSSNYTVNEKLPIESCGMAFILFVEAIFCMLALTIKITQY